MRGKAQVRADWEQGIEWQHRRERAELMREHGRQSRGMEQEWAAAERQRERKPENTNEEFSRKIADELIKQSGGLKRPKRDYGGSIERLYKQNEKQNEPQQERDRGRGPDRDSGPSR